VAIREAVEKADGVVFRRMLSDSVADRGLELPAWMFDRAVNRPFNCGLQSSSLLTFLSPQPGTAVALVPSELVGVAETGRARLACDCQPSIG
jgi:hypothetical protein